MFHPGEPTLDSLRRAATSVDFAVFVWGEDDRTISRKRASTSPRDNVVYEAGLFAGYLGSERTFVVHARAAKLPTDYLGVTTMPQMDTANLSARINEAMHRLGPLPTARIVGSWWQLVTSGSLSSSVISFFEIVIQPDTRVVSMEGTSWNRAGHCVATWHCPAAAFDAAAMTLHYSWEGLHTTEENIPTYLGVGQINFRTEPFIGYFSSTPRDLRTATVLRRARYVKASPNDGDILFGTDSRARRRLIRQRLRQRAIFADS